MDGHMCNLFHFSHGRSLNHYLVLHLSADHCVPDPDPRVMRDIANDFPVNDRAASKPCGLPSGISMRKMITPPFWQFPCPSPSQYVVNPDNTMPREFNICNMMFNSSKPVGRGMLVIMIYVLNRDTVIEWLHLTPTRLP